MHFSNRCGTESICGNRHWPSSAMRAPSIWPLLLSATVAVGTLNKGEGRQKNHTTNRANRRLSFILWVFRMSAVFFILYFLEFQLFVVFFPKSKIVSKAGVIYRKVLF